MNKTIIQRLDAIEHEFERRREAWQSPDPLSVGLHEIHKDDLLALAAELDAMERASYG